MYTMGAATSQHRQTTRGGGWSALDPIAETAEHKAMGWCLWGQGHDWYQHL